jgi:hypothetical protein
VVSLGQSNKGAAGVGLGGAAAEGGVFFGKAAKFEKLHNSESHLKAVAAIQAVMDKPGATQEMVIDAVFRQGQPCLNQFFLGKIELEGLKFYEDAGKFRCTWAGDSDVDEVVGRVIGQAVFRQPDGTVPEKREAFTLEVGDGVDKKQHDVVQVFLQGKVHSLNMENAILSEVTKEKTNNHDVHVPDDKRFTNYLLVDRMISEVGPIFELFALGEVDDVDSFGAVMGEVKTTLVDVADLSSSDQRDLVIGEKRGIQTFVIEALKAADRVLQKLFKGKDLLSEIETGRLFPSGKQHFKHILAKARKTTAAIREEQSTFPSRYEDKGLSLGELPLLECPGCTACCELPQLQPGLQSAAVFDCTML